MDPGMSRFSSSSPSSRRSFRSPHSSDFAAKNNDPWLRATSTYQWIADQQQAYGNTHVASRRAETPRSHNATSTTYRAASVYQLNVKQWGVFPVNLIEVEMEMWRENEERKKRKTEMREREKTRMIREEIGQIESRIKAKQEAEKENKKKERARRAAAAASRWDNKVIDSWSRYEEMWKHLLSPYPTTNGTGTALRFDDIPWPTVDASQSAEDVRLGTVIQFLFSQLHSHGQTRRQRIRSALLRWHPDRFQRVLDRVAEEDREQVAKAAGSISRCLNTLLARETAIAENKA